MSHGTNGYSKGCRCEVCRKAYSVWLKGYRAKPEIQARRYAEHLRAAYGLELTDLERMISEQGGACAICRRTLIRTRKQTHVDHDHATGRVRGVLCNRCNKGLGYFEDDPAALATAAQYVGAT